MYLQLIILLGTVAIVINGELLVPTCPPVPERDLCIVDCRQHSECRDDLLCCRSGCGGHYCKEPVYVNVDKAGRCPVQTGFGICAFMCNSDNDCRENLKCCGTNCGGTSCQTPV